jgi:hypothetical protein
MPTTYGTIQTMTRAYQQICAGEDPWIALGNFRNAWYSYTRDFRSTLVSEMPAQPEHDTEHTWRWRVFCVASVEFLCDRYEIPCPEWVHDPLYTLETPWWHTRHTYDPSIRTKLMEITPAPFARRNIFCGNRLYQNKYEMSTWAQEARAKGVTDPGEIWRYARQKEVSIHGG